VHPAFDLPKTCVWQLLRQEPLILLAPSSLAVKAPLVTASHEPFIRYDRNVVAGKMADEYLRLHGVRPKVHFELDGIEQIAKLVAEGLGVSVLPDWPVIGSPDPKLRRWRLPSPCPARRVGMTWLRASVRSQLAEEFAKVASSERSNDRKKNENRSRTR
jgi:DNA-binding transcriptional LysR family regulator